MLYLCIVFDSKKTCFIILNLRKMKKVVLSLAVLFSVALVACSNKDANKADSDTIAADTIEAVDTTVADTNAADTTVADSNAAPAVETPAN